MFQNHHQDFDFLGDFLNLTYFGEDFLNIYLHDDIMKYPFRS
jgi:hypothetical protein